MVFGFTVLMNQLLDFCDIIAGDTLVGACTDEN